MKLSRRCFLSFVIGGAAGTTLSPLPWKLTDDLSIWSQNWPWTPVPPDGEATYVNTTCTLCPGSCAVRVRKVDDRAVKIEGREETAIRQAGGICLLGASGLQLLYGPARVQGPLKRVGERGQGQFKAISWQEAIDEATAKLAEIRSQGNPQSLACLTSRASGTVPQLFKRLLTAFGSPNFFRMPSVDDAYDTVLSLTEGVDGFAGLDVEHADFILSFGSGLLDGYGAPPRMMQAVGRLKGQHGTLVQIEQRLSNTAAKADVWLTPAPGTEADLALAMICAIIDEGRYHAEFVSGYTQGFNAFATMVKEKYAPEAVARTTGIASETIIKIAMAFADAKHPLAIYGRGKGQIPGSLKEALAVNALNALVGNINRQGGFQAIRAYDYINWPKAAVDAVAAAGLRTTSLDGGRRDDIALPGRLVHRLINTANSTPGELQVLLVSEANPCYSLPDTATVKQAFAKIPFIVSFSSFLDETAMQADLILPNHVFLERYEDVPVMAGMPMQVVGLCRPVVNPVFNTQHVGDSVIQIAKSLKGSVADAFTWPDYESCLQETLGGQWDNMIDKGFWVVASSETASRERGFNTPSGKLVLMDDTLEAVYLADAPMPSGDKNSFPLLLMPYDAIRLTSRYVGDPPFMMKIVPDTVLKGQEGFVDVNPETAGQIGLTEGGTAVLSTPLSEAKVRIHIDNGVMPGVLSMPRGLGHTGYSPYLAGKGVNINQLIAPVEDPASGLDAAWGIRAKLTKA